jgi:hypothetical protein
MDFKAKYHIWKLHGDLITARLLLWIAGAGRTGDPTPDAHRYLANLYAAFAECYKQDNNFVAVRKYSTNAAFHFRLAGPEIDPDNNPPAAALAMPIPKRLIFTDAVSRIHIDNPPDGAA